MKPRKEPVAAFSAVEQLAMETRRYRTLWIAAQFGLRANVGGNLGVLCDEVCRVAAEGLAAAYTQLLIYRANEQDFLLQAGVGWPDGTVGRTWIDADPGTTAGFAWHTGHSITCNNVGDGNGFRVPDLMPKQGFCRSMNIIVPGEEGPFGVLEVANPRPGAFSIYDRLFLQILVSSLAAAIGRANQHALQQERAALLSAPALKARR